MPCTVIGIFGADDMLMPVASFDVGMEIAAL